MSSDPARDLARPARGRSVRAARRRPARQARGARPARAPAGRAPLFLQGDAAAAFYLLAEGRVKVYKLLRDGRTATLRHVRPGADVRRVGALPRDLSVEHRDDDRLSRSTASTRERVPRAAARRASARGRTCSPPWRELLALLNRRVEELLLPVPARLARYLLAGRRAARAAHAGRRGPRVVQAADQQARAGRASRHRARDPQPHLRPLQARRGHPHEQRATSSSRSCDFPAAAPSGAGVARPPRLRF